jgi:hypothetical protein
MVNGGIRLIARRPYRSAMVRLARVFSLIPSLSIKKACVDAETFAFQVLVFSFSRRLSGVVEVAKERRIPRNKRNGFSVVLARLEDAALVHSQRRKGRAGQTTSDRRQEPRPKDVLHDRRRNRH